MNFSSAASTTLGNTALNITTTTVPPIATANVGDYITDTSYTPFLREQPIEFIAFGLRPGATLYSFFDNINVTAFITPCTVANNVYTPTGNIGSVLVANTSGGVAGIFSVPPATFFVGDRNFLIMDVNSIASQSAATTQSLAVFHAFNFRPGLYTRPMDNPNANSTYTTGVTPTPPAIPTPPTVNAIATPVLVPNNTFGAWANLVSTSNTGVATLTLTGNSVTITGITQPIMLGFTFASANVWSNCQARGGSITCNWDNTSSGLEAAANSSLIFQTFSKGNNLVFNQWWTDPAWQWAGGFYNPAVFVANTTNCDSHTIFSAANGCVISFSATAIQGGYSYNGPNPAPGFEWLFPGVSANNIMRLNTTVTVINLSSGNTILGTFTVNLANEGTAYTGT